MNPDSSELILSDPRTVDYCPLGADSLRHWL
jgi:hypothetical protein